MARQRDRVMVLLSEWGGGKGGIHSLAISLMQKLRNQKRPVTCVLGTLRHMMNAYDKDQAKTLDIDLIEPNIEDLEDIAQKTPDEIISRCDVYSEVIPELNNCSRILAFGKSTAKLAQYLMESGDASGCEAVFVNAEDDLSEESMVELTELVRSYFDVVSVGYKTYRHLNAQMHALDDEEDVKAKTHLLIPNFSHLLSVCKPQGSAEVENCIFIPHLHESHQNLLDICHGAVTLCNDTFDKMSQPEKKIQLIVQITSKITRQHSDIKYVTCESLPEVEKFAHRSFLVICCGKLAECGFSGLEFLMNSHPTFILEDSDVGEILKKVSRISAESLLMKGKACETQEADVKHLEKLLMTSVQDKKSLTKVTVALMEELHKQKEFVESQNVLMKLLTSESIPQTTPKRSDRILEMFDALTEADLLGRGSYSSVYKLDDSRAVKVVRIGGIDINIEVAKKEIEIMNRIKHNETSNVVQFQGCYYNSCGNIIYIVMDLAKETMEQFMKYKRDSYKRLTLLQLVDVTEQSFNGLAYLHSKLIVHRDIKPSNILFSDNLVVWLADFGTARIKTRQSLESTTQNDVSHDIKRPGTAYYQAPEVQIHGRRAQPHSDVWTSSLVGTEWFTGQRPWKIRQMIDLVTKKEGECMPDCLHKVQDDNIRNLLTEGLSYDRRSRPTAAEVRTKLNTIKEMLHIGSKMSGLEINTKLVSPTAASVARDFGEGVHESPVVRNTEITDNETKLKMALSVATTVRDENVAEDWSEKHESVGIPDSPCKSESGDISSNNSSLEHNTILNTTIARPSNKSHRTDLFNTGGSDILESNNTQTGNSATMFQQETLTSDNSLASDIPNNANVMSVASADATMLPQNVPVVSEVPNCMGSMPATSQDRTTPNTTSEAPGHTDNNQIASAETPKPQKPVPSKMSDQMDGTATVVLDSPEITTPNVLKINEKSDHTDNKTIASAETQELPEPQNQVTKDIWNRKDGMTSTTPCVSTPNELLVTKEVSNHEDVISTVSAATMPVQERTQSNTSMTSLVSDHTIEDKAVATTDSPRDISSPNRSKTSHCDVCDPTNDGPAASTGTSLPQALETLNANDTFECADNSSAKWSTAISMEAAAHTCTSSNGDNADSITLHSRATFQCGSAGSKMHSQTKLTFTDNGKGKTGKGKKKKRKSNLAISRQECTKTVGTMPVGAETCALPSAVSDSEGSKEGAFHQLSGKNKRSGALRRRLKGMSSQEVMRNPKKKSTSATSCVTAPAVDNTGSSDADAAAANCNPSVTFVKKDTFRVPYDVDSLCLTASKQLIMCSESEGKAEIIPKLGRGAKVRIIPPGICCLCNVAMYGDLVIAADTKKKRLYLFNLRGQRQSEIELSFKPRGISVSGCQIYVCGERGMLYRLELHENLQLKNTHLVNLESDITEMNTVSVVNEQLVVICDRNVQAYSTAGRLMWTYAKEKSTCSNKNTTIRSVAQDNKNNTYIADLVNRCIVVVSAHGSTVSTININACPWALAVSQDTLCVACVDKTVHIFHLTVS